MERLGKNYNLKVKNDIRSQIGCVNKKNPQVIYIVGKTWVKLNDNINTNNLEWNIISQIKKQISNELRNFDSIFSKRYIFDLDFNYDGVVKDKFKFLSYSLYLKQNGNRKIENILAMLTNIANDLSYSVNKLFTINSFELSSSKKK